MELNEARKLFSGDHFACDCAGAVIDAVGDGFARCSIALCEKHKNAVGNVMGGVMFTLADFAFAVASCADVRQVVSLSSNIVYLASPKGTLLTAEASRVKDGRSTCCYRVTIGDDLGAQIAEVIITGFHKTGV